MTTTLKTIFDQFTIQYSPNNINNHKINKLINLTERLSSFSIKPASTPSSGQIDQTEALPTQKQKKMNKR